VKNQYVGDIGDFGKVLLLKHLAVLGFRLGINWLLTVDDDSEDGRHRDYINYRKQHCLCSCDLELFNKMQTLAKHPRASRNIIILEDIIRDFSCSTVFYRRLYKPTCDRQMVEEEALHVLNSQVSDLVFFDPDNGIDFGKRYSEKHVYVDHLQHYWSRGQSILTYHHLGRNGSHEEQIKRLKDRLVVSLKDSIVYAYHVRRGSARVYMLCIQPEHLSRIYGSDEIPSLQALIKTKGEWAKIRSQSGQLCEVTHG